MFGFVVAGIAFIALILLLTIKVTPEDSEQKKEKKEKQKKRSAPKTAEPENETKAHSRSVRLDKMTEMLVHLMEDGNVSEIQQAV